MNARIAIASLRSHSTTVSPYDFPMEVTYTLDEGEPAIFWPTELAHPGSPPVVELHSCKVGGVDIYEMLSLGQIERIEDEILDQVEGW